MERGLGGEAQIAASPYDLTKPMMMVPVPRNDGKNENPSYIFLYRCAVVHVPPLLLERGLGGEARTSPLFIFGEACPTDHSGGGSSGEDFVQLSVS